MSYDTRSIAQPMYANLMQVLPIVCGDNIHFQ